MPEMKYLTENVLKAVILVFDQVKFQGFEYVPFKSETRDQMVELANKSLAFTKEKLAEMDIDQARKAQALEKISQKLIDIFGKHIKQDVPVIFKEFLTSSEVNKKAASTTPAGPSGGGDDNAPDWRYVLGPELVARLTNK